MSQHDPIPEMIGTGEAILSLKQLIRRVAPSEATVLIIGESGTGKELVARALHDQSHRRSGAFVPVNCGAIPRDLIESELFGHRRGAFTGAIADRKGRFELAHGGTLFLDEIGDLALDMQVKLLRAIQERSVDPIGSGKPLPVDVRVVAATHRDLELEVQQGRFREDLYYRLNVLPVSTPPLRERKEDLPLLVEHFCGLHASPTGEQVRLSANLQAALSDYHWPGNIRELSNLVARFTALFAGSTIRYEDVPPLMLPKGMRGLSIEQLPEAEIEPAAEPEPNPIADLIAFTQGDSLFQLDGVPLKQKMTDFERGLIERALDQADGNISKTARILNVQRTTLIEKINKYSLKTRPEADGLVT